MRLHDIVVAFDEKWAPKDDTQRTEFLKDLRNLMNIYAKRSMDSGRLLEKDVPEDWKD